MNEYDSDPRNIWNVSQENVDLIYDRFRKFHGIGPEKARMAQFLLVQKHGVAGGETSKQYVEVKADRHVIKVLYRMGLAKEKTKASAKNCIKEAGPLSSQADLDSVLFEVGREFCHAGKKKKPQCDECDLKRLRLCAMKHLD